MKVLVLSLVVVFALGMPALTVEKRQTPQGPRILVDGEVRLPRFYYGSPTCLCNISGVSKTTLKIPFAADCDTDSGRVVLTGYFGTDPLWYSNARLVDLNTGATNVVLRADEEVRSAAWTAGNLKLTKGHRFNMFVMRWPQFDAYCSWLFDVLFELEHRLDISSYSPYDARVFGFVGERLLDVWLGVQVDVRMTELPVLHLESQHWPTKIMGFLSRKLRG